MKIEEVNKQILAYISNNFYKPISLFLGCFLLLPILSFKEIFDEIVNATQIPISSIGIRFTVWLILCIFWFCFWIFKKNYFPKNKKNKIGIVVGIRSQNDKQKSRLNDNLIARLETLIFENNLTNLINIIVLNDYQSKKVSEAINHRLESKSSAKRWGEIRQSTNGHFFVYGAIKEGLDGGENTYVFDYNALIVHRPISQNTQAEIIKEFLSAWYKQVSFQEKIELKGFEFTADAIFLCVQHLVGIAALVSGDVVTALKLHNALNNNPYFHKFKLLPPNLAYIKNKAKILLAEENLLMAQICYRNNDLENSELYLNKSFQIQNNYNALVFRSIIELNNKNDPNKSLKTTYEAKELAKNDLTWRYNEGFILMYLERFPKALKVYDKIVKQSYNGEKDRLEEVYLFNENFLKQNPEKIQSYFILGFLKYKKSLNGVDALGYFEDFIQKAGDDPKFQLLVVRAKVYKDEIEKSLKNG